MQLITSIKVDGLRSIDSAAIDVNGSYFALVGRNSSGKSNTLRALNLFFNGEVEPGKRINFQRDHYETVPKRKVKKKISIEIDFSIHAGFKFRKELDALKALGDRFSIKRVWELDKQRLPSDRLCLLVDEQEIDDGAELARQFLSLINYRYIPSRSVPSAILRDEAQIVASSIFRRMKGDVHSAALMKALSEAASRLLGDASTALNQSGSPLSAPSIATAESIGEMLTMGGFQAKGPTGIDVQDEDWGSGHQSFFLYQLLLTIDTSYGNFFGWKQATIWGVEEPESGLHRDLEAALATLFREWAYKEDRKIQMFITTHSPVLVMSCDSGAYVSQHDGASSIEVMPIPDLTSIADRQGVSGWVHPVLHFPWNVVVLVEGETDRQALGHVATLMGRQEFRFVALKDLDTGEKRGGKDNIINFLKRSKGLIPNRAQQYPLVVLFDWDVSNDDMNKARSAYGDNAAQSVLKMNTDHCPIELGSDFRGIERFYPTRVFIDARDAEEIAVAVAADGELSISSAQLNRGKGRLCGRVLDINDLDLLEPLVRVVSDLDQALPD